MALPAASEPVSVLVRDAQTHYAVPATVKLTGPHVLVMRTDAAGHLSQMVTTSEGGGWYAFEISAPGYRPAKARLLPGLSGRLSVMLVRETPRREEQPSSVASEKLPGYVLLHGYAVDADTGQPVPGVRVRVKAMGQTVTDVKGHYWLRVPKAKPQAIGDPPALTVVAEKAGFETNISEPFPAGVEDIQGLIFDMKKGQPWAVLGHKLQSGRAPLAAGLDLNLKDERGWTALSLACERGDIAMAKSLIDAGADVNAGGPRGVTPLILAASRHVEIVRVLIKAGAVINKKDNDGITALAMARWMCRSQIVEELTTAGAVTAPGEWTRAPQFQDFPVTSRYEGVPAPVNLRSSPGAYQFRTQLRKGARKGPNFAGHYTIVSWGCGSNCESNTIIDATTGRIHGGFGDDKGAEFSIASRLVIADPDSSGGNAYPDDPTAFLPVRYYEWKDNRFRLIYEQACTVVEKHEICGCEGFPSAYSEQSR